MTRLSLMLHLTLLTLMLMLAGAGMPALAQDDDARPTVLAWITVSPAGSGIEVTGHALALTDLEVSVRLAINRSGPGGNATVNRGSGATLVQGKATQVGGTLLSFEPGSTLSVTLDIIAGGETVSRAEIGNLPEAGAVRAAR